VVGIVGIGAGDAGEQILIALAGQQIAVVERLLAEIGQQRIARRIGCDIEAAHSDALRIGGVVLRSRAGLGALARRVALFARGRFGPFHVHHRHIACAHLFALSEIHLHQPP
jgi:hypothetical protein